MERGLAFPRPQRHPPFPGRVVPHVRLRRIGSCRIGAIFDDEDANICVLQNSITDARNRPAHCRTCGTTRSWERWMALPGRGNARPRSFLRRLPGEASRVSDSCVARMGANGSSSPTPAGVQFSYSEGALVAIVTTQPAGRKPPNRTDEDASDRASLI